MTELAVRETAQVATWTPSFVVSVDEAVAQVHAKHEFFKRVMREGEHYGSIPGTKPKDGEIERKVLFKSGAELLLSNMGLRPELSDGDTPTVDYGGQEEGLIRYRRVCRIYRQMGEERMLVAQAEGSCSSRETKYRWRASKRKCPACGVEAIIKGKHEYGGGWLCFKKQDGCNAKFKDGDPAIEAQTVGRIPNPDLADLENTILKMADKRALVAATLLATGCSDIFTQDVGDVDDPPAQGGDVIEGEFTESVLVRPAVVVEIKALAEVLHFSAERLAKGAMKMSDGTTDVVEKLLPAQGDTLLAYLRREADKIRGKACELCTATPEADGLTIEHLYDKMPPHGPCPNDVSEQADLVRQAIEKLKTSGVNQEEVPF